jgi:serine/threonine protein kinase
VKFTMTENIRSFLDAISESADIEIVDPITIADRRGSLVVRSKSSAGDLAIKIGIPPDANSHPSTPDAFLLVKRESEVLRLINHLKTTYLVASGVIDRLSISFLITKWTDGVPLLRNFRQCKKAGGDAKHLLDEGIRDLLAALEQLHRAGWCHGDIQPDHIISAADHRGAFLLDYALAHGKRTPTEITYKGGLVHFNAPEICRSLISGQNAYPTILTDLYSLGGVIFLAATEHVYPAYADDPKKLPWNVLVQTIADQRFNDLEEARNHVSFGAFRLMKACLDNDPTVRPSSAKRAAEILNEG